MKKFQKMMIALTAAFCFSLVAPQLSAVAPQVGVVNFRTCVENSKFGKQEQANFDNLRKQMEEVLEEKEKTLTELSNKFNDPDYLDSLSPEAEAELKHKFRSLNQEMSQHQQQYYQILNQANMKIIQTIADSINEAAKVVAKNRRLDLIINQEGTFFYQNTLDVSDDIVKEMDRNFKPQQAKS